MTANIPITLVNVLTAAFVVVTILGMALGIYAARAMKKMEDESTTE